MQPTGNTEESYCRNYGNRRGGCLGGVACRKRARTGPAPDGAASGRCAAAPSAAHSRDHARAPTLICRQTMLRTANEQLLDSMSSRPRPCRGLHQPGQAHANSERGAGRPAIRLAASPSSASWPRTRRSWSRGYHRAGAGRASRAMSVPPTQTSPSYPYRKQTSAVASAG